MIDAAAKRPVEPRKAPKQARAIATCDAIVEASARILEQSGPNALNTNAIAEAAGVSIGTLYQYYPDKRAILVALIRRERDALLRELRQISPSSETVLDDMIAASMRHQFERPRLASALESLELTLNVDAEAAQMAQDIAMLSSELLAARFGKAGAEELLTAVVIGRSLINAAADGLLPTIGLADRVTTAVSAYLERAQAEAHRSAGAV
jgi:AcrR family transcriptional regulator